MLEIVSPGPEHEDIENVLATIVSIVAEELDIDFRPSGHTTFRRPSAEQGFEADASFYLGDEPEARNVTAINPVAGPPPNLVIEVDVTHPALDKLPIYVTFGVPEVWRHYDDCVDILVLGEQGYREATTSSVLPLVTAETLARLVAESRTRIRLEWLRQLRAWVRAQRHRS